MLKVVLDTNVFVRGYISKHGKPAQILDSYYKGNFILITSPKIIQEIERVLRRDRIRKFTKMKNEEINEFIDLLWLEAEVMPGRYTVEKVSSDLSDDKFLSCDVEARADYLVTEDEKHLLSLKEYHLIDYTLRIVNSSDFLGQLEKRVLK